MIKLWLQTRNKTWFTVLMLFLGVSVKVKLKTIGNKFPVVFLGP